MNIGIIYALIALVAWGFDDFYIHKVTRKIGVATALFFVTIFGSLVLLPFVWSDIINPTFWTLDTALQILFLTSIITIASAVLNYKALNSGKLSVIEPIYALELPATLLVAYVFINEGFSQTQLLLIISLFLGIILVSNKSLNIIKNFAWETGVKLALLSALFMGISNFLTGFSGRLSSPLVANWFIYTVLMLALFCYLTASGKIKSIIPSLKNESKNIVFLSSADLVAWVAFTYSAYYIQIALATAISEAYIALAAFLGIWLKKEKLKKHQLFGASLAILSVIILAYIS